LGGKIIHEASFRGEGKIREGGGGQLNKWLAVKGARNWNISISMKKTKSDVKEDVGGNGQGGERKRKKGDEKEEQTAVPPVPIFPRPGTLILTLSPY